jgi:hypothetical protein
MDSLPDDAAGAGPLAVLSRFRLDFHACLTARREEIFELADAVLCADGPVRDRAGLSLAPEHRRGHGALYDAVSHGRISITRLRRALAGLPLPRAADGRLMLAVDVSSWLRPGAATSPGRLFCHVYGRGKGQAQMIPGWPYSVVAALEPGRTSWTAVLDAVRLGPDDDEIAVTAAQVRDVITRLIEAGHWRDGDAPVLVIFDAGYDLTRLACLLADLPAQVLGRLRSDRVVQLPAPPRQPGTRGRPCKHGGELALAGPATWPAPHVTTSTLTSRYGTAVAAAWDRVHSRLTHRAAWLDHDGPLPVIEGTLIRLQAGHLRGDRNPKPVWLWSSATGAANRVMGGAPAGLVVLTRSGASTGTSGAGPDHHTRSLPRLARPGGSGPGCQTPTVGLTRVVADAAGAVSRAAAGVSPYFTKCRGTTCRVAGYLLKSPSVPHTGQVSTRRPFLWGPPVPEHSIRRRVMGHLPACRGLVHTLPLSFRLQQIHSPFTLRSCAIGMSGHGPSGLQPSMRAVSEAGDGSRPAEWCNRPRESSRWRCRLHYGAMVAGMAIALA